ncbi:MAG TPA: OsmC family protein [Cyclobacteriaceae bacterium]|nr:OsmC family protein [Cyclobacteriaceae bacterium]
MKRKATAVWNGTGKEGTGVLTTDSGVLSSTKYNFRSRFEDGKETNPEELVAAAHAGCYVMKLSFVLGEAGFTPDELQAECTVTLQDGSIKTSHLELKAKIKDIDNDTFQECARKAKDECPISLSLNASISLNATLN